MCGIAGIFLDDPRDRTSKTPIWQMIAAMSNRGPDGQQAWIDYGASLGHVRLSIIDLDNRSDQPFVDKDTGLIITYNGEIYNFIELREELKALGYYFRTDGDTEVIVKAYHQWGIDCLNRFNGMWAFAIYDQQKGELFCSRDRLGVKPFVYACDQEKIVFASECKAIISAYGEFQQPHYAFVNYFLQTGHFAGTEATFYKDIYNLLPGHYFLVRHGQRPKPRRYWFWEPTVSRQYMSDDSALEQFQTLLMDSIRIRFRSDVPVGVCLSGGMDSSSIVGFATHLFQKPISTFSCVYPSFPEYDESSYILETIHKFSANAHLVEPNYHKEDVFPLMMKSIWEQDGPTGSPAVLSQRAVMQSAQGRVKVLLDGQGADEVLGGYHSYFPYSIQSEFRKLLKRPSFGNLLEFFQMSQAVRERTGVKGPSLSRLWRQSKLETDFNILAFGHQALSDFAPVENDDLNTRLLEDLLYTSLPHLLHYEDRNSMAFSIESRLPFLDYRLVEFAFSLSHAFKIRGAQTKYLLSESTRSILPPRILNRREKMGYATPGHTWFRTAEAQEALDHYFVHPPEALRPFITEQEKTLSEEWVRCQAGASMPAHRERLFWRYLTTCLWLDNSIPSSRPALHVVGRHSNPV